MRWAHLSCALWIPEIVIADTERMEPIANISDIPVCFILSINVVFFGTFSDALMTKNYIITEVQSLTKTFDNLNITRSTLRTVWL